MHFAEAGTYGTLYLAVDRSTQRIVEYADALTYEDLSSACIEAAKVRLADSIGCLLGGFDSPPARIARELAKTIVGNPGARVVGDGTVTAPDVAAFTNGVMLRYLDYNDTWVSRGSLHPSDLIPAVLAVAEVTHASGKDLLLGVVLGYEVAGALSHGISTRERGFDQGIFVGIASAVAAGKLMGLRGAQLGHALSLALIPHVPLRQTRAGALSMWKGCATASAARSGVFAAQLAALGMTGPGEPFEGKDGLFERVTGAFDFQLPNRGGAFVVEETNIKLHPTEYHSQAFLDLVPFILERTNVDQIDALDVETYWVCYSEIGAESAKWQPDTRETADHSLPFILAIALRDGRVSLDSFSDANIHDPELRALMQRITVRLNDEFTDRYPDEIVNRVTVSTRSSGTFVLDGQLPRGHFRNPAGAADLDRKWVSLAEGVVTPERRDAIRQILGSIDEIGDSASLVDALVWER